jgi:hypothetical protein
VPYLERSSHIGPHVSEDEQPYEDEHEEDPLSVHHRVHHNRCVFARDYVDRGADEL